MGAVFAYVAGVMSGLLIAGLAVVGPVFFHRDRMPTKEEWKAGGRQSW